MTAKADRARVRGYELREAKWWKKRGFWAEAAWNECRGFIRTKRGKIPIIKRRDFFGAFDVAAVKYAYAAYIQVTESPFERTDGTADRNAFHGEPPFALEHPPVTVEDWADSPLAGEGGVVQVIVSYSNPRKPERRWWYQR